MESIDNQLAALNQQIQTLTDVSSIQADLNPNNQSTSDELIRLQVKDDELVDQLDSLQQLWMISNLIKEIEINLDLYEFETVFYSFNKLKEKLTDDLKDNPIVNDKIYELDTSILNKITNVWNQLLEVLEDKITYNSEIDIDENTLLFSTIYDTINKNKLPVPQSNISHIIDQTLLSALINSHTVLKLDDNSISIVKTANQPSIQEKIESVKDLILFIQQFSISESLIYYVQTRLFTWLKHLLTVNIESVYGNAELQSEFRNLGKFLNEQGLKKNSLIEWIDSELNNIVIEYYLNSHIEKVRTVFSEIDDSVFTNLITIKGVIDQVPKVTKPETQNTEDDWGWDNDVVFDEPEPETAKVTKLEKKEVDDDDNWDAWNEEGDDIEDINDEWGAWDEEEEEKPKPSKLKSKSKSNTIKPKSHLVSKLSKAKTSKVSPEPSVPKSPNVQRITTVPNKILEIFKSYISTNTKLPSQYHDEHYSKLNYLATAYYILAIDLFEQEPILLYNDLTYILTSFKIPRLSELTDNLLLTTIESYEYELSTAFKQLKGLDPSLDSSTTFKIIDLLQKQLNTTIKNLSNLSDFEIFNKAMISIIDKFYQNIIDSIMSKPSIGEDESEYLNVIIDKLLGLNIEGFESLKNLVKNYTKLIHIKFVLSNHMSEIMDSFYQAVFYDLDTNELISLIDKLFADSDLKSRNIQEIRELREAI